LEPLARSRLGLLAFGSLAVVSAFGGAAFVVAVGGVLICFFSELESPPQADSASATLASRAGRERI